MATRLVVAGVPLSVQAPAANEAVTVDAAITPEDTEHVYSYLRACTHKRPNVSTLPAAAALSMRTHGNAQGVNAGRRRSDTCSGRATVQAGQSQHGVGYTGDTSRKGCREYPRGVFGGDTVHGTRQDNRNFVAGITRVARGAGATE